MYKNLPVVLAVALALCASVAAAPKPPAKLAAKVAYDTRPFDDSVESLPPGYPGHDLATLSGKVPVEPKKGEFEKTVEYEARVAHWAAKPFLGPLTPSSLLAFQIDPHAPESPLSFAYNADTEVATVKLNMRQLITPDGLFQWVAASHTEKEGGSYVGQTRMGVKFRIHRRTTKELGIGIVDDVQPITVELPVELAKAIPLKRTLRAFIVGTLAPPYMVLEHDAHTPTLDSPEELDTFTYGAAMKLRAIWLVDTASGAVLKKITTFKNR